MEENTMIKTNIEEDFTKYLSFYIAGVEYAVDIKYVTDIIKLMPITATPKVPKYIKGIINLRGQVVPIVDMRIRFGKEEEEYTDSTCIIKMEYQGLPLGILVDAVSEVADIENAKIMSPPKSNDVKHNRFVNGISNLNGRVKLIINCMQIFELE